MCPSASTTLYVRVIAVSSVKSVEGHRATGHHPMLGGGRDSGGIEPLFDHVRCAREEPIAVRIVSRPQDFVRADIVGQIAEAPLDWLERNPALPPENVGGSSLEAAVVEALVVEMPVHPIEPRRDPAAAGFEET